jgi:hypothetical protein
MRQLIVILLFLFSLKGYSQSYAPNSCLVNSIRVYEDVARKFNNRDIWNNVLIFKFDIRSNNRTITMGHAVSIFNWQDKYFVYDINQGSFILNTASDLRNDPFKAARLIYPNHRIRYAKYMVQ